MSKAALNETRIKSAKPGNKLRDGNGLYLEIRLTGTKLWRYRYKIDGRENLYALGEYAAPPVAETEAEAQGRRNGNRFSLKEARIERDRCRALVKQGTGANSGGVS